jgi:hypothetical protein
VLTALLLAAAPFGPPDAPLRLSAGFGTGQLEGDTDTDTEAHARTGQATVEWLGGPWRAGLGYRTVLRDVERRCEPVAGDPTPGRCPQGGARGRDTRHALSLTAGWAFEWAAASVGAAWRVRNTVDPDGGGGTTHVFGPAGHLRLGPADFISLRAAYGDPAPETPGTGEARAGVEFTPGDGRVLVGAVREAPAWGLLLAGQVPLSPRIGLAVSGAAHPTHPERLVLVGVGLVFAWDVFAD